jgi:outer membrane lipoprotein-sorting protein
MALFRTEVVTKGRLLYRRPDHLRWETFAPDASVLVVTGRQAVLRLPDTPPRQIDLREGGTMAALVDQMLTWLGARPAAELRERYRISAREGSSGTELSLTPKGGALAESITRIRLQLGPDDLLRSVMVRQKSGDTTTITFADVQRNKPLPDGTFR